MAETGFQLIVPAPSLRPSNAARIGKLSVGEKVKLAYLGNQDDRRVLIHDPNRHIASCVVKSGRLTAPEVAHFARHPNTSSAVVREIAKSTSMTKAYPVKLALVNNPKTPVQVSMRLVHQLQRRDLHALTRSREIPGAVLRAAQQTYQRRYSA